MGIKEIREHFYSKELRKQAAFYNDEKNADKAMIVTGNSNCFNVIACLKENRKILWYMAVAALVINSLLPSLFFFFFLTWNYNLSMQTVGGLLIFTILGYLFSVTEFTKKQSVIIYFLAISAVLLKFVGTVIFSYEKGALDGSRCRKQDPRAESR